MQENLRNYLLLNNKISLFNLYRDPAICSNTGMIRNLQRWRAWEVAHIARQPPDAVRAFAIADALYLEARALGVWNTPFTMESIRHKNLGETHESTRTRCKLCPSRR